ncbi:MAG: hypothetical protein N3H31_05655 [Candidatus Nezhaarchaeota archaeon]|nr:hypothetical protein [Candidatus Nezhaarchaeota archaeon]
MSITPPTRLVVERRKDAYRGELLRAAGSSLFVLLVTLISLR